MTRNAPAADVHIGGVPVTLGSRTDAYAAIKDRPGLIKDQATGAVLNTDHQGLIAYRSRRQQVRDQQALASRVDALERKLDLILAALTNKQESSK